MVMETPAGSPKKDSETPEAAPSGGATLTRELGTIDGSESAARRASLIPGTSGGGARASWPTSPNSYLAICAAMSSRAAVEVSVRGRAVPERRIAVPMFTKCSSSRSTAAPRCSADVTSISRSCPTR